MSAIGRIAQAHTAEGLRSSPTLYKSIVPRTVVRECVNYMQIEGSRICEVALCREGRDESRQAAGERCNMIQANIGEVKIRQTTHVEILQNFLSHAMSRRQRGYAAGVAFLVQ